MYQINLFDYIPGEKPIDLGHQGEDKAYCLITDLSDFKDKFGEGSWQYWYRRPGETEWYIAENTYEIEDTAVWILSKTNTNNFGEGRVELRYFDTNDQFLAKTDVYAFYLKASPMEDSGDAPTPSQSLIDEMARIWAQIQTAETDIQQYASDAAQSASEAASAAQEAVDAEVANLQAQLDQAISGVTVDSEVINARVGTDATTYSTLKARLDAENANLKNELRNIKPAQIKGASNLGDLIQFYGTEIVTGKYVYGVAGSSVKFGNNASYKYAVVPVVADTVYKFPAVSWWALTDENDIVVYGCGNNGTRVSNVDTSGYSTAAKLYVSFVVDATAYIIDNDTNTTEYIWTLDGLVLQTNNNVFAIPSFKHITGKAWNLYFSGGWLRNAEYKRTTTGNAQYDDHFTYRISDSAPGAVNHTIRIYDNNFDPIGQNVERMTYVNPNYRNITAMFIGDSTINDGRLTEKVLEVFATNNVTCTLLGTTGSGTNKREGRSGWSAADYCGLTTRGRDTAQNPFYNPSTQTFDFSYYMEQQGYSAPDFVFLQLGINDMFSVSMSGFETGYTAYKTNMLNIINSIHAYNSSIKIVVNLITMPNGNISAFNTLYGANYYNWERRYVDIRANNKLISDLPNYVLLNPHNLILDPMTNIRDDVHPTADGYAILGEFDANYMFAN